MNQDHECQPTPGELVLAAVLVPRQWAIHTNFSVYYLWPIQNMIESRQLYHIAGYFRGCKFS